MYKSFFKRFLDFFIAGIGLILLSPILIVVAVLLFLSTKKNPFFFQIRPGKDARLFKIVKFKTMNDKRDSEGTLLPDQERLTSVGAFLRKTSLDEIPQLINVVKGDMSIIGPRPLLPEYLPLYDEKQITRHQVRPGITGWAQINGRNAISWQEKFNYDVWYVNHLSFSLDFKILLLTLKKVVIKEGISSNTSATMEKFTGN